MTLYTALEFNEKFKDKLFIKLTNESENHRCFQYQTGLNTDIIPFNPTGKYQAGGLYFCELNKLGEWINYVTINLEGKYDSMFYVRFVKIPHGAEVYEEIDSFKSDQLILGERQKIEDLEIWNDQSYCLMTVKLNGYALQYVRNQTDEICLEAVKKCGSVLKYVINQTHEICLQAVQNDHAALQYVNHQTPEICLEAIKKNGLALRYVNHKTFELCLQAVESNYWAIEYVQNQTIDICLIALKKNPYTIRFIKDELKEISIETYEKISNRRFFVDDEIY